MRSPRPESFLIRCGNSLPASPALRLPRLSPSRILPAPHKRPCRALTMRTVPRQIISPNSYIKIYPRGIQNMENTMIEGINVAISTRGERSPGTHRAVLGLSFNKQGSVDCVSLWQPRLNSNKAQIEQADPVSLGLRGIEPKDLREKHGTRSQKPASTRCCVLGSGLYPARLRHLPHWPSATASVSRSGNGHDGS